VSRRFLAQRATTKEWLHRDLPIDGAPEEALSATGAFQATITPEVLGLNGEDGRPILEPWGTFLYLEEAGEIRWGGLVIDLRFDGPALTVEGAGFMAYLHGLPFTGDLEAIDEDPAEVVRRILQHLQSFPDGDLGLEVVGSTSARIGSEPRDVEFTTGDGEDVAFEAGPYTLHWADTVDCGREVDDLAKEAPFEWREEHRWNADRTDVEHRLVIADRLGAVRRDLRFVQGENVVEVVPVALEGDDFANEVVGLGAGEGPGALRSTAAIRDGRLRRAKVLERKDVRSKTRLDAATADALRSAGLAHVATSITVREHPHAPLGALQLGDVIFVQPDLPWLGKTSLTGRIQKIRRTSPTRAEVTLAPV